MMNSTASPSEIFSEVCRRIAYGEVFYTKETYASGLSRDFSGHVIEVLKGGKIENIQTDRQYDKWVDDAYEIIKSVQPEGEAEKHAFLSTRVESYLGLDWKKIEELVHTLREVRK